MSLPSVVFEFYFGFLVFALCFNFVFKISIVEIKIEIRTYI